MPSMPMTLLTMYGKRLTRPLTSFTPSTQVPLVQHHNNANVSMVADSNSLAVGIWYLSALGATFGGYACMFIYFMTKSDEVFTVQAQALDLCIRLIVCPVFSLPPPSPLLDYFQAKYGSAVVNDNPNTMIEEGITNDPRPRRPPMLVNQRTGSSMRRNSDYMFDLPSFNTSSLNPSTSYSSHPAPLYPPQESDEERLQAMIGVSGKPVRIF
ncbi:hypothetical protein MVEG_04715 [Podila verticillata NRRL 6337]|nr:hypothetical protein MVEG_04715 [Podila verticillata NRRL 6337]